MAKYSRLEVAEIVKETGLIPSFFSSNLETCKTVLNACYDGGVEVVEYRKEKDFNNFIFQELLNYISEELPGLILGVGSVKTSADALILIELGANFINTPFLTKEIVFECNNQKVFWTAKCAKLSDVVNSEKYGCELVELDTNLVNTTSFISNLLVSRPWSNIIIYERNYPTSNSIFQYFLLGVDGIKIHLNINQNNLYPNLKSEISSTLLLIQDARVKKSIKFIEKFI